jgi:hypothetical protein
LERESHQLLPVQKGKKQRRENERCRALPSPSTTKSTREDVSRDHSALAIAYLPQRRPTQLPENNTEKSTNDTSFESHFGKTHSAPFGLGAGHKRKFEKELGQAGIESPKRPWKSEPAAASSNLDLKERLELPGDGLSKKQKVQFEETVPKTNVLVTESPEKPAKELRVREIEQKERHDPISYWAAHHTWPENFTEHNPMASSNSTNKRPRTSNFSQNGKDERSPSYSQSRKNGEVPEQYTAAYERHILTKGLDMDPLKGEELVSEESKILCINLQRITHKTIEPTIFPTGVIRKVINFCRNRNEAIVNRDVTPMIIPSITSLYFGGDNSLEHVVDEVNADWYSYCVLEGPQLRPDLAIGLFSSAFTEEEIDKLKRYTSVNNWTQVTLQMFLPFLMCEVKCGREGLDIADRQNMHSCSVAVRALLRIEQEADKYRQEIRKKAESLSRQVLVFSISHDQQDARLYGHYAIVQGEKWTYYRYPIQKFDLTKKDSLLAIHNFVRNILKSHLPEHVQRLKDALAALPDPNKPPESSGLPGSSGLSFAASGISLNDDNSQQESQDRDADGYVVPPRPDSSQNGGAKRKGQESQLVERIDKLMQQLEKEREENRKREERQRQEHKEEVERQRQEHKEEVERQRQEYKEEVDRQRKESEEKMDKLLQRLLGKAAN